MSERLQPTTSSQRNSSIGYLRAPSNAAELVHFVRDCLDVSQPDHVRSDRELLLQYILKSQQKHRSQFRTTLMLMGKSGAGKSSTANHLLNSNILPVGHSASETRSVSEFVATSSSRTLKVKNLALSLVDTPGMNDDSGIAQDACNMWAIKKFLKEGNNGAGRGSFPNVILLCIDATEKRFAGPKSVFVRNLELLQAMAVIDADNPNLVIVLTNACSIAHAENIESWKKELEEKANLMQNITRRKFGFIAPYVFLENNFQRWNLPYDDENSGTVLPNGSVQPANLYRTIMQVLDANEDQLGYLTIRQFYEQGSFWQNFSTAREIQCTNAMTDDLDDNELECRDILCEKSDAYRIINERYETERRNHIMELDICQNQLEAYMGSYAASEGVDWGVEHQTAGTRNLTNQNLIDDGNQQAPIARSERVASLYDTPLGSSDAGLPLPILPDITSQTSSLLEGVAAIDDSNDSQSQAGSMLNPRATGRRTVTAGTRLPQRDRRRQYSVLRLAYGLLGAACLGILVVVFPENISIMSGVAAVAPTILRFLGLSTFWPF